MVDLWYKKYSSKKGTSIKLGIKEKNDFFVALSVNYRISKHIVLILALNQYLSNGRR